MCYTGSENHNNWQRNWHGSFPFAKFVPHIMRHISRHMEECWGKAGSWVPHNVEDSGDYYLVTVPLPGRTKEEVNVSLIGNNLNIKAGKPKGDDTEKDMPKGSHSPFHRCFFSFIEVDMDIPLAANADLDSIKSVMANGLLKVKIGKKPSKKIDVNDASNN